MLDEEWLGPHVGPEARSRMGDVALVPSDPVAFVEPKPEPRSGAGGGGRPVFELLGRHGSLTSAEMLVPCLAAFGTRG